MKRMLVYLCALALIVSCTPQKKAATPVDSSIKAFENATLVYAEGVVTMDGNIIEVGTSINDGALLQTDTTGTAEIVLVKRISSRWGRTRVYELR